MAGGGVGRQRMGALAAARASAALSQQTQEAKLGSAEEVPLFVQALLKNIWGKEFMRRNEFCIARDCGTIYSPSTKRTTAGRQPGKGEV